MGGGDGEGEGRCHKPEESESLPEHVLNQKIHLITGLIDSGVTHCYTLTVSLAPLVAIPV